LPKFSKIVHLKVEIFVKIVKFVKSKKIGKEIFGNTPRSVQLNLSPDTADSVVLPWSPLLLPSAKAKTILGTLYFNLLQLILVTRVRQTFCWISNVVLHAKIVLRQIFFYAKIIFLRQFFYAKKRQKMQIIVYTKIFFTPK